MCHAPYLTRIGYINNSFAKILQEFDSITRPTRVLTPKHSVQHQIVTHGHPIAEQARRLSPTRLQAA